MKTESITISEILPVSEKELYNAWLNSEAHSKFTGSIAKIEPKVGGKFTAWDEYISGKTTALEPHKKISQDWRTTEFADSDPDSKLEVIFEKVDNGTKITFHHTNIPAGQSENYLEGWRDYYFTPMKKYFKK
ncbi:MAG: SRPBCC domain-containing protein [Patescibacteria group bacterium]|nr:SRPBCC domain-containing protein [Patescibacteria group bacterium]